ncbi:hypothetical protein GCM10011609_46580 [Lentzea pudingi]|nr:hypothetical protein GCM10011609_46580 [Lentzea pudingi]
MFPSCSCHDDHIPRCGSRHDMTWARPAIAEPETGTFAEAKALEKEHSTIQNSKAARTVACHATDALDCADLLEMLGLSATEGKVRV